MKSDVAIIGGGPSGTVCAMGLLDAGIRPTIVESDAFPRFHIGESMTGECATVLRNLRLETMMTEHRHPVKHGTAVYGPSGQDSFWIPVMGRAADGALFDATTWQVRRSDFDAMLLDEAMRRGATVVKGRAVEALRTCDGGVRGLVIETAEGETTEIESHVVVDTSGQRTFLANHGVTSRKELGKYDKQVAIFSHVRGAARDPGDAAGNTIIFYQGWLHWAWFIPIDEDTVSIGVVAPGSYFASRKESKEDFYLRELKELNPQLRERVSQIDLVEEVRAIANYSYRVQRFAGPGHLCVGDAHRFIDPIFSLGLFFAVQEAHEAAGQVAQYLEGTDPSNPFAAYQQRCEQGMDVIQDMIDAFWSHPLGFAYLVHSKYREDCIDMFAGRVYMDTPSPGLLALRALNAHPVNKWA